MGKFNEYNINFKGLKPGEHLYQYDIDDKFFESFESSPITKSNLQVKLIFDKRSETLFQLHFNLTGTMELNCHRCLDKFNFPVNKEFSLLIKLENAGTNYDDDLVIMPIETQQLNVMQYIYEFFTLLVPMKQTCNLVEKDCNMTMVEKLGEYSLDNRKNDDIDPRWLGLKDIFKKNDNN